jgi:hypothetical protein
MNSSSGKGDLTELSWGGTGFHGFGVVSQYIADRDEVDFGGAEFWNQVGISWLVVAVSVVILWRRESSLIGSGVVEQTSGELKRKVGN